MTNHITSAALIIIGNEILSGRTKDTNLAWLGEQLNLKGVRLMEVRVIPDVESTIVATVNELRARYDYVFTTGGIGPTHDDITTAAIAKAFGRKVVLHQDVKTLFEKHYGDQLNEARMKMAHVPEGAVLIPNPVSVAPGFQLENVYVMAGVPRIMQAMFDALKHGLAGSAPVLSRSLSVFLTEGVIAARLSAIQDQNPDVEIGSYPFVRLNRLGTSLVVRTPDQVALDRAYNAIDAMLTELGGERAVDAA